MMERRVRKTTPNKNAQYVYGNTVRRLDYYPESSPSVSRQGTTNKAIRRNKERALAMDLPYLVILTFAAMVALFVCCNYLSVQSDLTTTMKNIATTQSKLEVLKNDNDALQTRIDTYVDLDYVYEVATQELGMVYANRNQVIMYNKTESEFVRQYEDIPNR